MQFSRYLYSKVKEAKTEFISLFLNEQEKKFLNSANVQFYKSEESEFTYTVNSAQLKELFLSN